MDAPRMPVEPTAGPFAVRLTADALDAAAAEITGVAASVLPARARVLLSADGAGVPGLLAPGAGAPVALRDAEVLAVVAGALVADPALLAVVELDAPRWPAPGHEHEHQGEHAGRGIARDGLDGLLLVRAVRSSAVATVQRRPLWWADRVHSSATVSLSYVLLDPADSTVLAAGVAVGHEERFGDVGAAIDAEPAARTWPALRRRRDGDAPSSPDAATPPVSPPPPVAAGMPIDSD